MPASSVFAQAPDSLADPHRKYSQLRISRRASECLRECLETCLAGRLQLSYFVLYGLWSWRRDLNPRPSDYKSDALPAELRQPTKAATSHTAPAALRKLNRRLGLQSEDSTPTCLMTMSRTTSHAIRFPVPAPGAAPQDSKPHRMLSFGTTYDFTKHFQWP